MSDAPIARRPYLVKEVAADARVTQNALYAMIKRKDLRVIRVGRAIRIPPSERDRLVNGSEAA